MKNLACTLNWSNFFNVEDPLAKQAFAMRWKTRRLIALDIGKGLEYLHSVQVLHRDLKSPNVLIVKRRVSTKQNYVILD